MAPFTPYDPATVQAAMFGINPTGGQNPSLPTPGPQPDDEELARQHLQSMIAPYQAMAQKLYGGNPVFGNSPFATNHPDLAGRLSNILLAGAAYQPGRSTGENIASVARMAIAPEQVARQRAIQEQMFPYQMLQSQMNLAHTVAETDELTQRGHYYGGAAQDLAEARSNELNTRANATTQGKPTQDIDQFGHPWWVSPDGSSHPVDPNYKPNYSPQLKTQQQIKSAQIAQGNSMIERMVERDNQENIIAGMPPMSSDERNRRIMTYSNQLAGGKAAAATAGTQNAPHPFTDTQTFFKVQEPHFYDDINKPPKNADESALDDVIAGKPMTPFQSKVDAYNRAKTARDKQVALYQKSSDLKEGIPFNPTKDYSKESVAPPLTPTSVSTPNWHPKL